MLEAAICGEVKVAMQRLLAALRQRCPRCLTGKVWRRFLSMNPTCPHCGLKFERDHGYFTGAMYVSYTLGILTAAPVWFVLLYFDVDPLRILAISAVQLALCLPVFYRYSRVFWMYLDMGVNPPDGWTDWSAQTPGKAPANARSRK